MSYHPLGIMLLARGLTEDSRDSYYPLICRRGTQLLMIFIISMKNGIILLGYTVLILPSI